MNIYFILIPAILIGMEGIFLIIYSFTKGVTFFSLLDLFLKGDVSLLTNYELYFFIGLIRVISAVYGGMEYHQNLQKKSDFILFAIELIAFSFSGLVAFLSNKFTMRIKIYWVIEVIIMCLLSTLFLIGIKKMRSYPT